ncbi:MAG: hypothetical protein NT007_18560 [Candidatus Kapabacteria bacterium]|nr:hypothetical protein [Candidatus Kapabacteria bacterium]
MFENFIKEETQKVRLMLDAAMEFIDLDGIIHIESLNNSYKKYFQGEAEWIIYQEQMQRLQNPLYNSRDAEIAEALSNLDDLLFKHARFPLSLMESYIDSLVKTRINLICRPRTTLKWFVFRGEPTKSYKEIILRLNYLHEYSYISEGFEYWANEENNVKTPETLVSVSDFEKVLEIFDNKYIFDLSIDDYLNLIDPIFEFFTPYLENISEKSAPIESLIIFHDDKMLYPIINELKILLDQGVKIISVSDFQSILLKISRESITSDVNHTALTSSSDKTEGIHTESNNILLIDESINEKIIEQTDNSEFNNEDHFNEALEFDIQESQSESTDQKKSETILENNSINENNIDQTDVPPDKPVLEPDMKVNNNVLQFELSGEIIDSDNNLAYSNEEIDAEYLNFETTANNIIENYSN